MMFNGLKVVAGLDMCKREQFRFPRSKKKRMRKKWRRDSRNWRYVPDRTVYQVFDTLYMHPVMIEELKRVLPAT